MMRQPALAVAHRKAEGCELSAYRCPLGAAQPASMDAEKVKREGWQDERILVVALNDDRLDFVERELVKQLGDRLYGRGRIDE